MTTDISLDDVYIQSQDIVSRNIEGEILIVPLTSGIGEADEDMYTLNKTGQSIWERLDGQRSLRDIATELAVEFEAPKSDIMQDVLGLVGELLKRRILVVVK